MKYLSVTEAQHCILNTVTRLATENVPLVAALGRVLAEDIQANRDQPPYDVSAMDGFALCSADIATAPATLEVIEDIKAGDMPTKALASGQCARIMTGAPVPAGADAVIRVEDTQALPDNRVQIQRSVQAGNDIRPLGEGMRKGEVVLGAGTEITPGVVGVLATVKARQVNVYRRPRVAILSTGNELEGMDEPVDPNKIPDSNSYALMAQMQALGLEPVRLGIARDDPQELEQYLRQGLAYDVLLVSGGTSVGVHDYVRPTVEALGVQMHFWRVAIRPGHPLAFGTTANTVVFGLPGNPVSSMVCVDEFVLPALRQMMGHPRLFRRTVQVRLAGAVQTRAGRTEFVRVTLRRDGDGYIATSTGNQSSGALVSMSKADGLLVVPAEHNGLEAGETATVQLLDGTVFAHEPGYHP
jgi:molybdopterin molybdotransferase